MYTVLLLVQGLRQRVPKVVLGRMVVNALVDALIGAIPVFGSVGDIFWRANTANLQLLERHARPGLPPASSDYVFVWIMAGILRPARRRTGVSEFVAGDHAAALDWPVASTQP